MARNANWDKAKRQAVGIMLSHETHTLATAYDLEISKRLRNHRGIPTPIIGPKVRTDRFVPEAAKLVYLNDQSTTAKDADAVAAYLANNGRVKVYKTGLDSSGRVHKGDWFRAKGAGCDPRTRSALVPGKAVIAKGLLGVA